MYIKIASWQSLAVGQAPFWFDARAFLACRGIPATPYSFCGSGITQQRTDRGTVRVGKQTSDCCARRKIYIYFKREIVNFSILYDSTIKQSLRGVLWERQPPLNEEKELKGGKNRRWLPTCVLLVWNQPPTTQHRMCKHPPEIFHRQQYGTKHRPHSLFKIEGV